MTNTIELEVAIKRAGLAKVDIAKALNLSNMGLHKKVTNETEFKASEIQQLQALLHLTADERDKIFFAS